MTPRTVQSWFVWMPCARLHTGGGPKTDQTILDHNLLYLMTGKIRKEMFPRSAAEGLDAQRAIYVKFRAQSHGGHRQGGGLW